MSKKYKSAVESLEKLLRPRMVAFERIPQDDAEMIVANWVDVFVPGEMKSNLKENPNWLLWHIFSYKSVRHVDGDSAKASFAKASKTLQYLWFCGSRRLPAYKCIPSPDGIDSDLVDEVAEIQWVFADSVWTGENFAWTLTATHEQDTTMALGPYFTRKEWMVRKT